MMMKKLLILLILISFFSCNKGDDNPIEEIVELEKIYEGYVNLSNQEEVDEFSFFGYTKIIGGIMIGTFSEGDSTIKDLSGLSTLNFIEGYLSISNNLAISSLEGLSNIEDEIESLQIINNPALRNLEGLEGITRVEGYIQIQNNDSLITLKGLDNIMIISKTLEISNNYKLKNLNGLGGLIIIGEHLRLDYNYELESVNGLNRLSSIGGEMEFRLNSSLSNLDGLINLIHIGDKLRISNNSDGSLTSIIGLRNLNSDLLEIEIIGTELSDFNGLNALSKVYSLNIQNNSKLVSLYGLNGIYHVRNDVKIHNCGIETLEGLEHLSWVAGNIKIQYNFNLRNLDALANVKAPYADNININNNVVLTDFCGLIPLLNDFSGEFIILDNAYNPSIEDVKGGNCSQ